MATTYKESKNENDYDSISIISIIGKKQHKAPIDIYAFIIKVEIRFVIKQNYKTKLNKAETPVIGIVTWSLSNQNT